MKKIICNIIKHMHHMMHRGCIMEHGEEWQEKQKDNDLKGEEHEH